MNFGEPVLYLLGLGYGLGAFIGQMGDLPYLSFLASGIVASSAMTTAAFEGMYSVYTCMEPQRTYEAILAGEMLWCGTKSLFSGIAILTVAGFLGVAQGWQVLWAMPAVVLIGLCFAGPALVMAAIARNYDFFNYYFVLAVTPMFMLCGVFYPTNTLPAVLQHFVQILPLTHAVALVRPLVTGQALTEPLIHVGVLGLYAAVSYYLAVVLVRKRLLV